MCVSCEAWSLLDMPGPEYLDNSEVGQGKKVGGQQDTIIASVIYKKVEPWEKNTTRDFLATKTLFYFFLKNGWLVRLLQFLNESWLCSRLPFCASHSTWRAEFSLCMRAWGGTVSSSLPTSHSLQLLHGPASPVRKNSFIGPLIAFFINFWELWLEDRSMKELQVVTLLTGLLKSHSLAGSFLPCLPHPLTGQGRSLLVPFHLAWCTHLWLPSWQLDLFQCPACLTAHLATQDHSSALGLPHLIITLYHALVYLPIFIFTQVHISLDLFSSSRSAFPSHWKA